MFFYYEASRKALEAGHISASFPFLFFPVQGGGGGIFKKAAHCWPFNREVDFNKSPDLRGGFPAMLKASAGRM